MRSRRRSASGPHARALPARSRLIVRRREAPLLRQSQLAAALRSSREALAAVDGHLAALLAALRDPAGLPDAEAADRLHGAAATAGSALASLGALARRG
jgi:hypothetical protein